MGEALWRLVEQWQDSQPVRPTVRGIARAAGIPPSTLANWRHIVELPKPEHLSAFARVTNYTTTQLLEAALQDYMSGVRDGTPTNLVVLSKGEHDALARAARRGKIEPGEDAHPS